METENRTTVVIADDHPIFLRGLTDVLEGHGRYDIVGKCANGREAMKFISNGKPDIAILDIVMPGMSGLDVIKKSKKMKTTTKFILITLYRVEEYFDEAVDLDVKGFLFKESAEKELLECLDVVCRGMNFISRELGKKVIEEAGKTKAPIIKSWVMGLLTRMERVMLKHTASYETSREAAAILKISARTVENHRANICRKLGLKGRNALVKFVSENRQIIKALDDT